MKAKMVTAFCAATMALVSSRAMSTEQGPTLLPSSVRPHELRLPPIPALSTMPWLGAGWQQGACVPTPSWHQDYLRLPTISSKVNEGDRAS
jgi:hypothetical protein